MARFGRGAAVAFALLLVAGCEPSGGVQEPGPTVARRHDPVVVDERGWLRWAPDARSPLPASDDHGFGSLVLDDDERGCLRAGGNVDGASFAWYPAVLPSRAALPVAPALPSLLGGGDVVSGTWATVEELATAGVALPPSACTPTSGIVGVYATDADTTVIPQWRSPTLTVPDVMQFRGATTHCGFGSATYLRTDKGIYTRDPQHLFDDDPWFRRADGTVRDRTLVVAGPPAGAEHSDLRRADGAELWVTVDAAYVVLDGVTEQWPLTTPAPLCA